MNVCVWLTAVLDADQIFTAEILPLLQPVLSDWDSASQIHIEKRLKWEEKSKAAVWGPGEG